MTRRAPTREAAAFILSALAALVTVGCGASGPRPMAEPVPYYRYPDIPGQNNLRLISMLTDPAAGRFAQGTAAPAEGPVERTIMKPVAVASAADHTVFVLDYGRGRIYRMTYDLNGELRGNSMLPRSGRVFPSAVDLEVTPAGDLWVVDSRLKSVFVISPNGDIIDSISSGFERPVGIAYHPLQQRMLVADLAGNAIVTFDLAAHHVATHNAGTGLRLEAPSYLAVGPEGRIYVVEALSARVRVFNSDWDSVGTFGGIGDGPGYFARPKGVVVDADSRIYVADALFDNVQIFREDGELLLTLGSTGSGLGEFWQPTGLALDSQERVYVADAFNRRVQVFGWEEAADR